MPPEYFKILLYCYWLSVLDWEATKIDFDTFNFFFFKWKILKWIYLKWMKDSPTKEIFKSMELSCMAIEMPKLVILLVVWTYLWER